MPILGKWRRVPSVGAGASSPPLPGPAFLCVHTFLLLLLFAGRKNKFPAKEVDAQGPKRAGRWRAGVQTWPILTLPSLPPQFSPNPHILAPVSAAAGRVARCWPQPRGRFMGVFFPPPAFSPWIGVNMNPSFIYSPIGCEACFLAGAAPVSVATTLRLFLCKALIDGVCVWVFYYAAWRVPSWELKSNKIQVVFFLLLLYFSLDLLASKKLSRDLINPGVVTFPELNLPSFASGTLVLMLFHRYAAGIKMCVWIYVRWGISAIGRGTRAAPRRISGTTKTPFTWRNETRAGKFCPRQRQ